MSYSEDDSVDSVLPKDVLSEAKLLSVLWNSVEIVLSDSVDAESSVEKASVDSELSELSVVCSESGLLLVKSFSFPTSDSPINSSVLTSVDDEISVEAGVDDRESDVLSETMVLLEYSSEVDKLLNSVEEEDDDETSSSVVSVISVVLGDSEVNIVASVVLSKVVVVVSKNSELISLESSVLPIVLLLSIPSVVLNSSFPEPSSVMKVSDTLALPETDENPSEERSDTELGLVTSPSPEPVSNVPSVL